MKTLRKLFYVACTGFFLASCEENYNDKLFWPGEISREYGSYIKPSNLDLTYSGEKLIGKTVHFKSENSETGTMTLNDVIPGEKETVIQGIQLHEMGDVYTFSGETITTTGAIVRYSGSITPKVLNLAVNTQLADKESFATTYAFNKYTANMDNYFITGGYYGKMIAKEGEENNLTFMPLINALLPNFLNQILPQVIQDITLARDGNIIARYSTDALNMEDIMNVIPTEKMQELINNRSYQPSPKGLAFWSKTGNNLLLQLNLPAIITEMTKGDNQNLDPKLIAGITEAVLKSDPNRLKSVLVTINAILDNQLLGYILKADNATFTALFSYLKNGILMNATYSENGNTYLFLDYQTLTPIINVISGIVIDLSGFTLDLGMIAKDWEILQTFNIGLNLEPQHK